MKYFWNYVFNVNSMLISTIKSTIAISSHKYRKESKSIKASKELEKSERERAEICDGSNAHVRKLVFFGCKDI